MDNDTWVTWVRPLVLAVLPAIAAGLVAWGAVQTRVVALVEDVARAEAVAAQAHEHIRALERQAETRAGDARVLQVSLSAIDSRLARIEARLYGTPHQP